MARIFGLLLLGWMMTTLWVFPVNAQEEAPTLYITRYRLAADPMMTVYGLFDLGSKPSVRLVYPSAKGGKVKLQLHGRHYVSPVERPFSLTVAFEDVTGRVFHQSKPIAFSGFKTSLAPQWFMELENVAGMFGGQTVELAVPPGTSVINLIGDDNGHAPSPNQLVGYISQIQIDAEP